MSHRHGLGQDLPAHLEVGAMTHRGDRGGGVVGGHGICMDRGHRSTIGQHPGHFRYGGEGQHRRVLHRQVSEVGLEDPCLKRPFP
ncbi:MAG: hypothetical protein M5U12_03190 [Verrucomicrobia bacterium]|nr:hypothetical protein [Verrucomicrobiota bacterium]